MDDLRRTRRGEPTLPLSLHVRVTADDIATGIPEEPAFCPVALATNRALRELGIDAESHVHTESIEVWIGDQTIGLATTPKAARDFEAVFDRAACPGCHGSGKEETSQRTHRNCSVCDGRGRLDVPAECSPFAFRIELARPALCEECGSSDDVRLWSANAALGVKRLCRTCRVRSVSQLASAPRFAS